MGVAAARRELEIRVERTSVGRDGCLGGMPRGSTAKSLWRRRWCSAPPARPPSAGLDVDGSRGAKTMGSWVFRRMIAASRGASFTTEKHGGTREAFADLSIARRPTACTQECLQSSGGRRALTRPRAVAAASRTVAKGTIVTILSTLCTTSRRVAPPPGFATDLCAAVFLSPVFLFKPKRGENAGRKKERNRQPKE